MKVTQGNFAKVSEGVSAALTNEQLTRKRVEALEADLLTVKLILGRGLGGRFKWLLRGK